MEQSRLTRRLVKRFVAGHSLAEALAVCRRLKGEGILSTLDYLGENVASAAEAAESAEKAREAIRLIRDNGLPATISIKLTQFGLDISEEECRGNVTKAVEAARAAGTQVEVDMESSEYVDRTLDLVRRLHGEYGNVRAVIQAYLYRSEQDVRQLCRERVPVRLCKGAYLEPAGVAFPEKTRVDGNYRKLMRILLEEGAVPALATHDEALLVEAGLIVKELGLKPEQYEFQMLYGVRRRLQRRLVEEGHRLRLYVPYGEAWYPYFMRRLAERPANVVFLVRQLAGG
ncbi:MAG: proline dehydrogenase [Acidimicrobiia bacterium]|nr:proline dehydrogenase [Acidimicrobiia bacterium]